MDKNNDFVLIPNKDGEPISSQIELEDVFFYIYPLIKETAVAEAKEGIRRKMYEIGLASWDLLKVLKVIDGVSEEEKPKDGEDDDF